MCSEDALRSTLKDDGQIQLRSEDFSKGKFMNSGPESLQQIWILYMKITF